ncbi:MAG: hypothetical protein C4320_01275, partial [Armatimonadota bacterium]
MGQVIRLFCAFAFLITAMPLKASIDAPCSLPLRRVETPRAADAMPCCVEKLAVKTPNCCALKIAPRATPADLHLAPKEDPCPCEMRADPHRASAPAQAVVPSSDNPPVAACPPAFLGVILSPATGSRIAGVGSRPPD